MTLVDLALAPVHPVMFELNIYGVTLRPLLTDGLYDALWGWAGTYVSFPALPPVLFGEILTIESSAKASKHQVPFIYHWYNYLQSQTPRGEHDPADTAAAGLWEIISKWQFGNGQKDLFKLGFSFPVRLSKYSKYKIK